MSFLQILTILFAVLFRRTAIDAPEGMRETALFAESALVGHFLYRHFGIFCQQICGFFHLDGGNICFRGLACRVLQTTAERGNAHTEFRGDSHDAEVAARQYLVHRLDDAQEELAVVVGHDGFFLWRFFLRNRLTLWKFRWLCWNFGRFRCFSRCFRWFFGKAFSQQFNFVDERLDMLLMAAFHPFDHILRVEEKKQYQNGGNEDAAAMGSPLVFVLFLQLVVAELGVVAL